MTTDKGIEVICKPMDPRKGMCTDCIFDGDRCGRSKAEEERLPCIHKDTGNMIIWIKK